MKNLSDFVEADLHRAARLIVKVQDEIDPQFRIATPAGDFAIAITLPADHAERLTVFDALGVFMTWKQAKAFTMASELNEPDAVWCAGVAGPDKCSGLMRITRHPRPWTMANFGPLEWIPPANFDPALAALLPIKPTPLTPKQVADCNRWFGPDGAFPAVHIPTRELRHL